MWEAFFGFKKTPFSDRPDAKQLFASAAWQQVKTRLEFLTQHPGVGLLTGEVGAGKSTAARVFTAALNPNLYKILQVHFTNGSALDLLRQMALALELTPAHFRGDLVRKIADAIVRLNQSKKQHPILICDEAHLLPHPALEQLPLLLNFDRDSSRYLTLLLPRWSPPNRPAPVAAHAVAADARGAASAHRRAFPLGGTHARGTRCVSDAATQSRRRHSAAV